MPRLPTLTYDRGTLLLHPPPRGKHWIDYASWDDRVEKFRIPACDYAHVLESLRAENCQFQDQAAAYTSLSLCPCLGLEPYPHQQEALQAWKTAQCRGVVVLPTAAGKTYLAQLAMVEAACPCLIVVPTLDLMHQWYAHLQTTFPDVESGLLGGGSHDRSPLLVATYDSAAIQAESLGHRYGMLICDECHHLPSDFYRVIAEFSLAPKRLGLTATPERSDGRHLELDHLLGPVIYRKTPEDLRGKALADHEIVQIKVQLSQEERERYQDLLRQRNQFLQQSGIHLGSLQGWQRFVQISSRSAAGRQAMQAHHAARTLALGSAGKMRVLSDLLARHYPDRTLIFSHDRESVYQISRTFLIPAITHQTPVKERHRILDQFRTGHYPTLVVANVLDEGVDVPEARIAIFLAGSGSNRQFTQRLGRILRRGDHPEKRAILYEVVAEDTLEEKSSSRRRQDPEAEESNLRVLRPKRQPATKAAEQPRKWASAGDEDEADL